MLYIFGCKQLSFWEGAAGGAAAASEPCDCTPRGPPWLDRGEKFGLFEPLKRDFLIQFGTTEHLVNTTQNHQIQEGVLRST